MRKKFKKADNKEKTVQDKVSRYVKEKTEEIKTKKKKKKGKGKNDKGVMS